MRLSQNEKRVIVEAVRKKDPAASVYLFGSRADDKARGGDIDLLVWSDKIGFREEWSIRRDILDAIGWQKLDLLVEKKNEPQRPIARIARETGVKL